MAFADDYVSVAARLARFLEQHPDGRIQTEITKHTDSLVIVRASVYRDAQDERPTVAHSQLGIPGKTNFTRDSEVENAETSAVGRALAFMGFESKKGIASREEVQSRHYEESRPEHVDPETGELAPAEGWLSDLKAELGQAGLVVPDLEAVLKMPLTKETYVGVIGSWLARGPHNTVKLLVSSAADLKAAGVRRQSEMAGAR